MKVKWILFLVIVFTTLSGCKASTDDPGARPTDPDNPDPTVETLKEASSYPIGVAVNNGRLRSSVDYTDLIKLEMSSITAENEMKMSELSSGNGTYNWSNADYIVDFAQSNKIRVHGHALVWHRSVPQWVNDFVGDRAAWIALLEEYITDVVTRYKGRIESWDVVNEAFEDDGTWRTNLWFTNIGGDYMDIAFRAAHAADPSAILFYNDYGMEYSEAKRAAIVAELNAMKTRGVPVHGIGLQMHASIYTTKENMSKSILAAAATGLKVHLSELDMAVNDINTPDPNLIFSEALKQIQKQSYKAMFEAMGEVAEEQQFGVTFWGVDDGHSWLTANPDWPLPFDVNLEKKPAYYGIMEALTK